MAKNTYFERRRPVLDLNAAIRERHSTRMFLLQQPVPRALVDEVLPSPSWRYRTLPTARRARRRFCAVTTPIIGRPAFLCFIGVVLLTYRSVTVSRVTMKNEVWGPPESICRSRLTLFIEAIKTLHFSS